MLSYEELLDRLYDSLPEEAKAPARFEIPRAEVEIHGKNTVVKNIKQIAEVFRRDPKHLVKFLTKELATSAVWEGDRIKLKGRFPPAVIQKKIVLYAQDYVLCPVCGKPDTRIITMGGVKMLKCDACGAISPLREL